jgi:glucosamine-6-phosphate deaminase
MLVNGMKICQYPSAQAAARALARHIARCVAAKPDLVLGLPTGRTPIPLYAELVALYRAGAIDFSRVVTFNLDEFLGLAADDPRSYRSFMARHLFDHVNLTPRRIHFLDGLAVDPDRECRRYERAIARAGGIDLLVLGLGTNGHIGFNEPARALVAATHRTRLTAATRRANASLFGNNRRQVPKEALSMGMSTILHARQLVLLATGPSKAHVVHRLVTGPIAPSVPASFLQLHRCAEVWVDRAAAERLTGRGSR